MLANLSAHEARVPWRLRFVLLACGVAVLGLPIVYLARPSSVQAADSQSVPEKAAGAASTAEPACEFFPKPSESERRLFEALDKNVTLTFTETPLAGAVEEIKKKLDGTVEIQLDIRALEDAGVGSDTPVTRNVKDVTLRTALRLLLDEYDLTYLFRNDVLLITTMDKAETELITRVYPIGDLVPPTTVAAAAPEAQSIYPQAPEKPGSKPVARKANPDSYDQLIEVITTTIRPQVWNEVGGPSSINKVPVSKSLVISLAWQDHEEVLALLRALRAAKRESTSGN